MYQILKNLSQWLVRPIPVLMVIFASVSATNISSELGWTFSDVFSRILEYYVSVRNFVFFPFEWFSIPIKFGFIDPWKEIFTLLMLYSMAQASDGFRGSRKPFRAWGIRILFGLLGSLIACAVTSYVLLQSNLDIVSTIILGVAVGMPIHRLGFSIQFALDRMEFENESFWSNFFIKISPILRWIWFIAFLFFLSSFLFSGQFVNVKLKYGIVFFILILLNKSYFHIYMTAKPREEKEGEGESPQNEFISFISFISRFPLKAGDNEFVNLPVMPKNDKLAIKADSGNAYVARHLIILSLFLITSALNLFPIWMFMVLAFDYASAKNKPLY